MTDKTGKYNADYSQLSPEQISANDPELTELLGNSSPMRRYKIGDKPPNPMHQLIVEGINPIREIAVCKDGVVIWSGSHAELCAALTNLYEEINIPRHDIK